MKPPPGPTNGQTLAEALRCSARTAQRLLHDGLEKLPDGTYNIPMARAMLAEREKREAGGGYTTKDLTTLRIKREQIKAEQDELALQLKKGEVIPLDDARHDWATRVLEIKQALMGFGREIVPQLDGLSFAEQQALIDARIREILTTLAHPTIAPDAELHKQLEIGAFPQKPA